MNHHREIPELYEPADLVDRMDECDNCGHRTDDLTHCERCGRYHCIDCMTTKELCADCHHGGPDEY